jgi:hypothetical protein
VKEILRVDLCPTRLLARYNTVDPQCEVQVKRTSELEESLTSCN